MDQIRIALLEKVGWTDLTRERKFSIGALKGTSPDGKKDQFAPNPCKSLDSLHAIERELDKGKYCGSIMERYVDRIYDNGMALSNAKERAKQLYYVLFPDPED